MSTYPKYKYQRKLADMSALISNARPEAIRSIVALIDNLSVRGDADVLIAPTRPRMGLMREMFRRPASLNRVLVAPSAYRLVPPHEWRRGSLYVPRSVLPVLIEAANAALPPQVKQHLTTRLSGVYMNDARAIQEVGEALWPTISGILAESATLKMPPGVDLPMREAELRTMLGAIGQALRVAPTLGRVLAAPQSGRLPDWEPIEPLLRELADEAASHSDDCFARTSLTLMRRFMMAGPVVGVLRDAATKSRGGAGEHVLVPPLDSFIARLHAELPDPEALGKLPHAVQQVVVADAVTTIERAAAEIGAWRADKRDSLREAQARMAAMIRQRVEVCMQAELLSPFAKVQADGPADQSLCTSIEGLEADARAVVVLTAAVRRLGPADDLAIAIRSAADTITAAASGASPGAPADGLGCADVARLVEILVGPDAAGRLLRLAA